MELSREDEAVLAGERGPALSFAMKVLVNLGDIEGAKELVPIVSAHVSGVSYHTAGEALITMLSDLVGKGGRVSVPTSLNPAGMDLDRYRELGYPEGFVEKQLRIIELYSKLGIEITCSCIPYEIPGPVNPVKFGDHLAWGESNAVIYANSVIGARSNREGGISALAAAILGRTPNYGMHLTDNRLPTLLVKVEGDLDHLHYDLLGAYIGKRYNSDVPYLTRSKGSPDTADLKHLGAAMAAKGGISMFHIERLTPEHRMIERVRETGSVKEQISITAKELDRAKEELFPAPSGEIEAFVLGCPQFGPSEFIRLHKALKGRKLKSGKRVLVFTSRDMRARIGPKMLRDIEEAGVEVYNDTCMVVTPLRDLGFGLVGTDSGKAAHYIPKMSKVDTGIFPMEMIVEMCT